MANTTALFSLLFALLPALAGAQWQSTVSLSTSVDDNAYRNYSETSDVATQLNFDVSRGWVNQKWSGQFYYDGYLYHFADNTDRTFQLHRFGLASQRQIGSGSGLLSLGGRINFRLDGEVYNIYDYSEVSGYLNLKWPLKKLVTLYTGYNFRERTYANLSELSNWEHSFWGRLNFSLPTRTTVIVSSGIAYKDYISQVVAQEIAPTDSDNHIRQGRGGSAEIIFNEVDNPSAGQWVNSLRVSQAVFGTTGLSSYLRNRLNFGTADRFITGLEAGYLSEDELYDDRFGYESLETGVMFSHLLTPSMMLRLGYDHYDKDYQRAALDLEGNALPEEILRSDIRKQFWGSISKTFKMRHLSKTAKLFLEYLYIANESNDPYYDFSATAVTLGTELSF